MPRRDINGPGLSVNVASGRSSRALDGFLLHLAFRGLSILVGVHPEQVVQRTLLGQASDRQDRSHYRAQGHQHRREDDGAQRRRRRHDEEDRPDDQPELSTEEGVFLHVGRVSRPPPLAAP